MVPAYKEALMIRPVRLSDLAPFPVDPNARQKTLERVAQFQAAQKELERVCAERGIPVPQMVC